MSSYIQRGESVFFQFRKGKSVLNSQNKPRMFKTAEKATLGVNYVDTDDVVEYAEIVRCKDCKYIQRSRVCDNMFACDRRAIRHTVKPDDFCSYGERREDDAAV